MCDCVEGADMRKCLRLSTCVYTVIAVVVCLGVFVGLKT